jgi:hypothetical protein
MRCHDLKGLIPALYKQLPAFPKRGGTPSNNSLERQVTELRLRPALCCLFALITQPRRIRIAFQLAGTRNRLWAFRPRLSSAARSSSLV